MLKHAPRPALLAVAKTLLVQLLLFNTRCGAFALLVRRDAWQRVLVVESIHSAETQNWCVETKQATKLQSVCARGACAIASCVVNCVDLPYYKLPGCHHPGPAAPADLCCAQLPKAPQRAGAGLVPRGGKPAQNIAQLACRCRARAQGWCVSATDSCLPRSAAVSPTLRTMESLTPYFLVGPKNRYCRCQGFKAGLAGLEMHKRSGSRRKIGGAEAQVLQVEREWQQQADGRVNRCARLGKDACWVSEQRAAGRTCRAARSHSALDLGVAGTCLR